MYKKVLFIDSGLFKRVFELSVCVLKGCLETTLTDLDW